MSDKELVVNAMKANLGARGISVDGVSAWQFVGDAIDALTKGKGDEYPDVDDLASWYEEQS